MRGTSVQHSHVQLASTGKVARAIIVQLDGRSPILPLLPLAPSVQKAGTRTIIDKKVVMDAQLAGGSQERDR